MILRSTILYDVHVLRDFEKRRRFPRCETAKKFVGELVVGKNTSHLSQVEDEGRQRLPVRGIHVRVGLVGDEFVVNQRRPHALGSVTPAQHVQELLLEVLRILRPKALFFVFCQNYKKKTQTHVV